MAYGIVHSGSFVSRPGVVWKADILRDGYAGTVSELEFPSDSPLVIEWAEKEKHEPVQSSSATLKVISPSDRKYADLYAVRPGAVRLDVYRAGQLFWSGSLDTEQYEEPYITDRGYEVSLTFSDFGPLDRIPYDLSGRRTLNTIVRAALSRACVNYVRLDASMVSTFFTDGAALTLASLSVASDNFFDEDGKALTWEEVLEGILQPLALRIVQRAGVIWVYDINGLCASKKASSIEWDGDDAVMGTDKVYNNVTVTFSPYNAKQELSGELDYKDTYGPEWTNLGINYITLRYNGSVVDSSRQDLPSCFSFYPDYSEDKKHNNNWDYNLVDFTVFVSDDGEKCKGPAEIGPYSHYFKIQPNLGGEESEGVLGGFYSGGHGSLSSGRPTWAPYGRAKRPRDHEEGVLVMRSEKLYLPELSESDRKSHYVKIELPLLFDPRYDPFEDAGSDNEQGNYDDVKSYGQFAFVPVAIQVYDESGKAVCHYDNKWLTEKAQPGIGVKYLAEDAYSGQTRWGWKDGAASFGDAWLSYYDLENMITGTGVLGWKTNRQSFGKPWTRDRNRVKNRDLHYTRLDDPTQTSMFWSYESFGKAPEGQFLTYPPKGGYLEITVYNGVWVFDDTEHFTLDASGTKFMTQGLYDKIRWVLYQLPKVGIVRGTLTFDEEENEDVEYSGVLNANAREDLGIDTVCGTMENASPSARGTYFRTSDGLQIQELTRAGYTDHPEQLLIATCYSQYAERHTVLDGTVLSDPESLRLYTDKAQAENVLFMPVSETMDARDGTSEVKFSETHSDEYKGK